MSASSRLLPIENSSALASWIQRSHDGPVVLLKHSATCGTSAHAFEEVEHFAASPGACPCGVVVVQTHRAVSNEVAAALAIEHQSPQVFVIDGGRVAWHASHWRITTQALVEAVARLDRVGTPKG